MQKHIALSTESDAGARIDVSFHSSVTLLLPWQHRITEVNEGADLIPVWRIAAGSNSMSVIELLNRAGALLLTKARELTQKCDDRRGVHRNLAPWQVRRITTHIKANLATTLRIQELAGVCRLSPSYFARTFSSSFGCPPHRFIMRCRLERAKELMLDSDLPLSQIATQCGFADQAHLSRIFLKLVGVSPARWRRSLASAPEGNRKRECRARPVIGGRPETTFVALDD